MIAAAILLPSVVANGETLPEWWGDVERAEAAQAEAAEAAAEAAAASGHGALGPQLEETPIRRPTDDEIAARAAARALAERDAPASRYGMQPGDLLQISVWREPELDREVQVSPDGFIAYPLIGEVPVAGLSIEETRVEIVRRLAEFVPRAVVTVSLKEMRGNRVYVLGKVNRPGVYPYFDTLDVMQALSLAGGSARFAELDRIRILRRVDGRQQAIDFDYAQVARGERLEQNISLRSGDIVLVP